MQAYPIGSLVRARLFAVITGGGTVAPKKELSFNAYNVNVSSYHNFVIQGAISFIMRQHFVHQYKNRQCGRAGCER